VIKISRIVIGTYNQKKKEEIRNILHGEPFELLDLENFKNPPDVVEDGVTFKENATKKAIELARFCKMCVVTDDSGLEVDALEKRPGVFSSRYCGVDASDSEKYLKILEELEGVPAEKRTARFKCAIAFASPDKLQFVVESSCDGFINTKPCGKYGFGYDPIFYIPQYKQTMAGLGADVKNRISHRALALRLFKERLKKFV